MKQLFLIFALLYGLNIQASDIYVALGQSISDAVRQAREMVRKGEAASVTIRLEPGIHRITETITLRTEDSGLTIEGNGAIISGGVSGISKDNSTSLIFQTSMVVLSISASYGSIRRKQSVPTMSTKIGRACIAS